MHLFKLKLSVFLFVVINQSGFTQSWTYEKFDVSKGLMSSDIAGLYIDTRGFLWVGNGPGLSRYDGKRFLHYTNDSVALPLHKNSTFDIYERKDHSIAYSTSFGYALVLKNEQAKIFAPKDCTLYMFDQDGPVDKPAEGMQNTDAAGNQYFREGMLAYKFENDLHPVQKEIKHPVSFLWMTTLVSNKGNVYRFYSIEKGARKAALYKIENADNVLITNKISFYVQGVFEDNDGATWIIPDEISNDKPLVKLKNGVLEKYKPGTNRLLHTTGNAYQYSNGNLLVAAYEGLVLIKKDGVRFFEDVNYGLFSEELTRVPGILKDIKEQNGYVINGHRLFDGQKIESPEIIEDLMRQGISIKDAIPDKEGNIWYATGNGLFRLYLLPFRGPLFELNDERIEFLSDSVSAANLRCVPDTFQMEAMCLTDRKNNVQYILPEDRRFIYVYNMSTRSLSKCNYSMTESKYIHERSYPLFAINDILICQEFSRGLVIYKLNKEKNKCTYELLNHSNGLLSNFVETVVSDANENIWIMSWDGIQVISYNDLYAGNYKNFITYPLTITHSFPPFIRNDVISFADKNWLYTIDTKDFHPNISPPALVFEKVSYSKNDKEINIDLSAPHQMVYNFRNLEIKFTGVCLSDGSKVRYKYMLEGLDDKWHEQSEDRVLYSTLPEGNYTFKLLACNNDGVWTKVPATFSFEVTPPWWNTKWAYIGYVLSFLGIVFGFNGVRTEQMRKRQRQLEQTVQERTAEIVKQKEEIESKNEELNTKNEELFQQNEEIAAQRDLIEEQKHLVEDKNKEIIDSINYAKRLQEAILPPVSMVREMLDSFVLYKPKDIVAGDFYYAEKAVDETQAEIILIAAADCTGHGVPGAMVSVVCSNALNRCVNELKITDPGKILDKTTELVVGTFEKSSSDVKDGMDISLISIDKKNRRIKWAGANNPLWVLQQSGEVYELLEVKANKQPIGKYDHRVAFTTHELQLKEGDMVYLFTDGYADQFGGPKGKKFKYKQLEEVLKQHVRLSASGQKDAIDSAFEDWKSGYDQVDDVCVIGIRM